MQFCSYNAVAMAHGLMYNNKSAVAVNERHYFQPVASAAQQLPSKAWLFTLAPYFSIIAAYKAPVSGNISANVASVEDYLAIDLQG